MAKIETIAVHAGTEVDRTTGAVMTPIYQTSTFAQSEPGVHKGWDYSRAGNPTRDAYEKALAQLETAQYGLAFSSGLAAEQAIIQSLEPGGTILVCDDVYGGTGRLFRTLFAKYGFDFKFVDMANFDKIDQEFGNSEIKMVWIETPTNPTMKVIDIARAAEFSKKTGAKLVVDNTFATPIFQQPLSLGADIVVHSTTKYIGGHSDLVGGAVMLNDDELHEKIKYVQFAAGAVPGPMDSFMYLRSIKTLAVRMSRHFENAMVVADFLRNEKKVKDVYFPGLDNHPQHALANSQMSGHSGMVSFDLDGSYDEVKKFLSRLEIFLLAESLGGVESLVNHPEEMTHASVPEPLRRKLGIGPTLIRLSVGIENPQDLVDDLKSAFAY